MAVEQILDKIKIEYKSVNLGEIVFGKFEIDPDSDTYHTLSNELITLGFEILSSKQSQNIDKIKRICLKELSQVSHSKTTLSKLISTEFNAEYSHLSKIFSSVEGITIEQYFISQRIEKVKELLSYNELTLSEIAFDLGFSSVAHLSSQFKKVSGMTPSYFRSLKT